MTISEAIRDEMAAALGIDPARCLCCKMDQERVLPFYNGVCHICLGPHSHNVHGQAYVPIFGQPELAGYRVRKVNHD